MQLYKNILLVYPKVPKNTYWSFHYSMKFIGKKTAMPPLGLITIASFFPENYHLRLVDMNIEELREVDLAWADAVFISAMLIQQESFSEVVERCNRMQIPVIAGGPYVTSSHENIIGVDYYILGEVEDTFQDFLQKFQKGTAPKVNSAKSYPDISNSSPPRFDLLDFDAYCSMSIQYSRGCPFKCEFCDIWSVYGNKPRLKSADSIVRELDCLYSQGWRGALFIVDDNFIGNKQRVKKELLPTLIRWQKAHNHPFRFFTEASVNMAEDDELLVGMKQAGFNEVFIGIESPSEKALQETGKSQNLRTNLQDSIQKIQNRGIEVMAGFIIGFDSDSPEIGLQQIRFIQDSGIPQAMVGLLEALPGTKLYRRLLKEGRILGSSKGNNTHHLQTNFKTRMSSEDLKNIYKRILSNIYDKNLKNYFERCNRLLDNVGESPFFQRRINLPEIKSFFRSITQQPFTRYGFQYIKFILRNAFINRKIFGEAIRFAIIGHHFHTITQETLKVERIISELEKLYQNLKTQLNRQSTIVLANSKETMQNIVELLQKKIKKLDQLSAKVENLNEEFRGDIKIRINEIDQKIKDLVSSIAINTRVENRIQ